MPLLFRRPIVVRMRCAVCRRFQIHTLQKALQTEKNPLLPYKASLAWEKELENFLFRSFCLCFFGKYSSCYPERYVLYTANSSQSLIIVYSVNIYPICDSPLQRSARRSFAPSQKSRRHNRSSKLFEVVKRHLPDVHAYADDDQLCISFKPGSS